MFLPFQNSLSIPWPKTWFMVISTSSKFHLSTSWPLTQCVIFSLQFLSTSLNPVHGIQMFSPFQNFISPSLKPVHGIQMFLSFQNFISPYLNLLHGRHMFLALKNVISPSHTPSMWYRAVTNISKFYLSISRPFQKIYHLKNLSLHFSTQYVVNRSLYHFKILSLHLSTEYMVYSYFYHFKILHVHLLTQYIVFPLVPLFPLFYFSISKPLTWYAFLYL